MVPLVTQFFSHHPSLTVDLWFDMFVATLWRPGLTFRFPGDPWSNSTSPRKEWFLTGFGASLCQHSLAPKFSILPLEFSQHAPSRSSLAVRPFFCQSGRSLAPWSGFLTEQRATCSAPGQQTSPAAHLRPTHPAPLALGRWYCPVSSCRDHCQESSRGWTSFKGLRFHLDLHFMGELSGQVPLGWLHQQGHGVCSVCNRVLSSHFNGLHPRCYRASTAASVQAPPSVSRPLIDGAPGLSDVSTSHGRLRTSIPAGARDLWSKCLIHALASAVAHRDERSWVDLLTMPALTLGGPSRGGRHHAPRQAITVSLRCQDWLDGLRAELWGPSGQPASHRQQDPGSDFRLRSHVSNRAATLIQDGALRRACTALTQEPPVQPTPSVIDELRGLHPLPRPQDSALLSCLRTIGPAAAPCVSRHDPESRV